ncbi:adenosylcobinamide-GDP ribazoletransferase [Clostridium sp. LBM24168]
MKKMINNFLLMVQFLTRIDINMNLNCQKENFRWGSIFMPVIGLIIGAIQWIVYKLLINVLPINISVIVIVLVGIMLTGAMHMDGLGDMCDGFFSFNGKDKIIEIMKDSRVGTYSCIAIVMDILFKYNLFCYIVPEFSASIMIAPVISRLSTLFLVAVGKEAKSTGTGNLFINSVNISQFFIGVSITIGMLLFIIAINLKYSILLIALAIMISFVFNLYCKRKIGGLTGDLLGANNEIVEISMLILISIIIIK